MKKCNSFYKMWKVGIWRESDGLQESAAFKTICKEENSCGKSRQFLKKQTIIRSFIDLASEGILKWIRCEAEEEKKSSFSAAQETWCDLKRCPGFLGQIGGWNVAKYWCFGKVLILINLLCAGNMTNFLSEAGKKGRITKSQWT
jgi:hypothetical protein